MNVSIYSLLLPAIDNVCDYVPFVSTVTNLIDIFHKVVVLNLIDETEIMDSHYYSHVQDKSLVRCIVLLVPILGNIVIGLLDYLDRNSFAPQPDPALENIEENKGPIVRSEKRLVIDLVLENPMELQSVKEEYKNDYDIVLAAVKADGLALQFASEELRNHFDIVWAAVDCDGLALEFASKELQDNEEIVLKSFPVKFGSINKSPLQFASERLQSKKEVVLEAIKVKAIAFLSANISLQYNVDFAIEAVKANKRVLPYVSETLSDERLINATGKATTI